MTVAAPFFGGQLELAEICPDVGHHHFQALPGEPFLLPEPFDDGVPRRESE
jgi:hypothetical protein